MQHATLLWQQPALARLLLAVSSGDALASAAFLRRVENNADGCDRRATPHVSLLLLMDRGWRDHDFAQKRLCRVENGFTLGPAAERQVLP